MLQKGKKHKDLLIASLILCIFIGVGFVSIWYYANYVEYSPTFELRYAGLSEDNSSYIIEISKKNPKGMECNTNISVVTICFSCYDFEAKVENLESSPNISGIAFKDMDNDGHISVGDQFYIGRYALKGKEIEDCEKWDVDHDGYEELNLFIYSNNGKIGEIRFETLEHV